MNLKKDTHTHTHTHTQLNHCAEHLKLTQCCKSTPVKKKVLIKNFFKVPNTK